MEWAHLWHLNAWCNCFWNWCFENRLALPAEETVWACRICRRFLAWPGNKVAWGVLRPSFLLWGVWARATDWRYMYTQCVQCPPSSLQWDATVHLPHGPTPEEGQNCGEYYQKHNWKMNHPWTPQFSSGDQVSTIEELRVTVSYLYCTHTYTGTQTLLLGTVSASIKGEFDNMLYVQCSSLGTGTRTRQARSQVCPAILRAMYHFKVIVRYPTCTCSC